MGDYDWWQLADVQRFKADEAAGLIETSSIDFVHGHAIKTEDGWHAFLSECVSRRAEREGPIDWEAREAEQRAHIQRMIAARDAGLRMEPLPAGAAAGEEKHWRKAFNETYTAAIAATDTGGDFR